MAKSQDMSLAIAEAAKLLARLDQDTLDIFLKGYALGRKHARTSDGTGPTTELTIEAGDELLDFHPEADLGDKTKGMLFAINAALPSAALESGTAAASGENLTKFAMHAIFVAFSRKGLPLTTATVPQTLMIRGIWESMGASIFEAVIDRFPKFERFADPTVLLGFYTKPIVAFAAYIRDGIRAG